MESRRSGATKSGARSQPGQETRAARGFGRLGGAGWRRRRLGRLAFIVVLVLLAVTPRSGLTVLELTSTPEEWRILTVGDGSFAFSAALRRRLDSMKGNYHLTATSFDSRAAVLKKYPESRTVLSRLARHRAVCVQHEVDATELGASDAVLRCAPYDLIIFNFPHCGIEDRNRHRCLLAHFFASSRELLRSCGQVQVALANKQPSQWAVEELAKRAGLTLLEARSFRPEVEFKGYTPRRHNSGTSFKRAGSSGVRMHAHRFTFAREAATSGGREGEAHDLSRLHAIWLPAEHMETSGGDFEDAACHLEGAQPAAGGQGPSGVVLGRCGACEEGELTDGGGKSCAPASRFICHDCSRRFQDAEALQQHRTAKHGRYPNIKPDWFCPPDRLTAFSAETAGQWWCEVCALWWQDERQHQRILQPTDSVEHICVCGRAFLSSRALLQHSNFCAQ